MEKLNAIVIDGKVYEADWTTDTFICNTCDLCQICTESANDFCNDYCKVVHLKTGETILCKECNEEIADLITNNHAQHPQDQEKAEKGDSGAKNRI